MRVIDTARMNRIATIEPKPFKWDLTKICVVLIFISLIGLYKRFKDLEGRRFERVPLES